MASEFPRNARIVIGDGGVVGVGLAHRPGDAGCREDAVMHEGELVSSTASVAYGQTIGNKPVFAYVKPDPTQPDVSHEVLIHGQARVLAEVAYAPSSLKPRTDLS